MSDETLRKIKTINKLMIKLHKELKKEECLRYILSKNKNNWRNVGLFYNISLSKIDSGTSGISSIINLIED